MPINFQISFLEFIQITLNQKIVKIKNRKFHQFSFQLFFKKLVLDIKPPLLVMTFTNSV